MGALLHKSKSLQEVTRLLEEVFLYVPPLIYAYKTRCVPLYTSTLRTDFRVPATVL
jgi:hypothetical protein